MAHSTAAAEPGFLAFLARSGGRIVGGPEQLAGVNGRFIQRFLVRLGVRASEIVDGNDENEALGVW